jgi:hypothetical protein
MLGSDPFEPIPFSPCPSWSLLRPAESVGEWTTNKAIASTPNTAAVSQKNRAFLDPRSAGSALSSRPGPMLSMRSSRISSVGWSASSLLAPRMTAVGSSPICSIPPSWISSALVIPANSAN